MIRTNLLFLAVVLQVVGASDLQAAAPVGFPAQGVPAVSDTAWANDPPDLGMLVGFAHEESELRDVIPAYVDARSELLRPEDGDPPGPDAQRAWYLSWLRELASLDFDALGVEGKVDYVLLRDRIESEVDALDRGIDLQASGDGPVGREALQAHLDREMIPYTPEEILAIADREWEWMAEARADAAQRMGHGDDWEAAIEEVKRSAVPPGGKPGVVRDLLNQSVDFIDERRSLTIPPLMREIWRMTMKSAERQVGGAFFNGGITIHVPYGTEDQSYERKMMSMRGNNPHFSRATVHHELMPGHGLQFFVSARFNPHRSRLFSSPFWMEGWALYHEFVLWDQGFARGPEDELGMLFWRMHRAARIKWIISYHLGLMTPEEGVEYLVEDLGFERANAEAEVGWGARAEPLYQAAYMLGGLQLQALRRELVDSGGMSERVFHDTFILGGRMPMEGNRLRLTGEGLERDYSSRWRFAGDPLGEPAERRIRPPIDLSDDGGVAPPNGGAPALGELVAEAERESDLRIVSRRFEEDLGDLRDRYDFAYSPVRLERERQFLEAWRERVGSLDPSILNESGRAEHMELRDRVAEELQHLDAEVRLADAWEPILPFARNVQLLKERWRDHLDVDAPESARMLNEVRTEAERLTELLAGAGPERVPEFRGIDPATVAAAVEHIATLQEDLEEWYTFYYGFDPDFTWWMRVPYENAVAALDAYADELDGAWR